MVLPLDLRSALFAVALLFHGMGLCVAAGNEASAAQQRPQTRAGEPAAGEAVRLVLLLPLASPDFARPAEALRLGFMAAARRNGDELRVGVIATDAAISIVIGVVKVSVFGLAGVLTAQVVAFALLIGIVALPGAFLAKAFVERMPVHVHTAILDAVVLLGGIVMVAAALR